MWSIFVHGAPSPLRDRGVATDIAGTDEHETCICELIRDT